MHLKQLRLSEYPVCLLGSVLVQFEDSLRMMCFNKTTYNEKQQATVENISMVVVRRANASLVRGGKPLRIISILPAEKKYHRITVVYLDKFDPKGAVNKEITVSLYEPSKKNKNKDDEDDGDHGTDDESPDGLKGPKRKREADPSP